MKINHNVTAQLANIGLKRNDNRLRDSLQRLSSGYKINKAADDAAGKAISNKMRMQISALDQANRNAADGDSVIQTAEGALTEIESILQRIRELGVQAANDTYTLEDRVAIQKEVDDMLSEIDRISTTTEFNDQCLLDGSSARTMMSNSIAIDAISASTAVPRGEYSLIVEEVATSASLSIDLTSGAEKIVLNGVEFDLTDSDAVGKIVAACDEMNIKAKVDDPDDPTSISLETRATGSNSKITLKYSNKDDVITSTGSDAKIKLEGPNKVKADDDTDDDAEEKETYSYISSGSLVTIKGNNGFEMKVDVLAATGDEPVTLRVEDAGYMQLQIGANEHQILNVDFSEVSTHALGLRDVKGNDIINACTQWGATSMIAVLDNALDSVSATRSTLGAYQNRLEKTQNNLDVSSENLTDAMSRIMDTDMAEEMTRYTQLSLLTQAATSMLAQANNRPQEIMSLLQS